MRANTDGTVTLTFEVAGTLTAVVADVVVFALPFSTLRDAELTQSGLSRNKQTVIETMGIGTNAKVHLELTHKTWPALGFSAALAQAPEGPYLFAGEHTSSENIGFLDGAVERAWTPRRRCCAACADRRTL